MAQTCTFKTERTFRYEAVNSQNIIKNFTTWAVNQIHKTNHHGIDKKVKMYSSVCICDRTTKLLYIYKSVGDSYLISKIKRKKKKKEKKIRFLCTEQISMSIFELNIVQFFFSEKQVQEDHLQLLSCNIYPRINIQERPSSTKYRSCVL